LLISSVAEKSAASADRSRSITRTLIILQLQMDTVAVVELWSDPPVPGSVAPRTGQAFVPQQRRL